MMLTKNGQIQEMCKMEKRRSISPKITRGVSPRGSQRVRILIALHEICRRIEKLQESEEARQACRDVAGLLAEARSLEERRFPRG